MTGQKSISTRLSLWLFGLGLLALSIGGSVIYLQVRSISLTAFDHILWSDVEIFTGLLHLEDGELEFEYAEAASGQYAIPRSGHYYQISRNDALFEGSASLAGEQLLVSAEQLDYADAERDLMVYTTIGPDGERLRVMERSVTFADQPTRVLVAHSLSETAAMLGSLRRFLLLGGAFGVLLMALLVWQISRTTLRPLRDFSIGINRIGEKNLHQRLENPSSYQEFVPFVTAFNALLERLQRSLQGREELLAEVSHQLKTPVAVIRSHCDIYLQQERPSAEYIEALEIIRSTSDSMGNCLRRLLSIAQSEADLIDASGFPIIQLQNCLDQARLTVAPLARQRKIEIAVQLQPGLTLRGHQERLVEAFSNLLENALKYNQPGGKVQIRTQQTDATIEICFIDSGCGIEPAEAQKIFQRFYRGRGSDLAEGSGLGLVLVKTIIEAHQGTITVSSPSPGGSCFCVTLPAAWQQIESRG